MSGWIKFDKDIPDDPRVLAIAEVLASRYTVSVTHWETEFASGGEDLSNANVTALLTALVTGAVTRLWCYADTHIRTDDTLPLTVTALDRVIGVPNFCHLLPDEWLIVTSDGTVQLPGYTSKNSLHAKARATEKNRERQARYRARRNGVSNARVTLLDRDRDRDLKNKKVPTEPCSVERDLGAVDRIFDHWRTTWKHPRAKLDAKRKRVIANALKGYSETDLRAAISGYLNSSHHCGENERRAVYDEIGLFLRDAAHIDAGLAFAQDRTNGPTKPELFFRRPGEWEAYRKAVEQGHEFADQASWEAFRDGQQAKTH